jgi:hypothetical protein
MSKPTNEPPYAAIHRLVEHVIKIEIKRAERQEQTEARADQHSRDHILNSALEVQTWLDVLEMTPWSQDTIDRDYQ